MDVVTRIHQQACDCESSSRKATQQILNYEFLTEPTTIPNPTKISLRLTPVNCPETPDKQFHYLCSIMSVLSLPLDRPHVVVRDSPLIAAVHECVNEKETRNQSRKLTYPIIAAFAKILIITERK